MITKAYQLVTNRLLKGMPKPKPWCKLVGNKFRRGWASVHKTPQAVKARMFWRIKNNRTWHLR